MSKQDKINCSKCGAVVEITPALANAIQDLMKSVQQYRQEALEGVAKIDMMMEAKVLREVIEANIEADRWVKKQLQDITMYLELRRGMRMKMLDQLQNNAKEGVAQFERLWGHPGCFKEFQKCQELLSKYGITA